MSGPLRQQKIAPDRPRRSHFVADRPSILPRGFSAALKFAVLALPSPALARARRAPRRQALSFPHMTASTGPRRPPSHSARGVSRGRRPREEAIRPGSARDPILTRALPPERLREIWERLRRQGLTDLDFERAGPSGFFSEVAIVQWSEAPPPRKPSGSREPSPPSEASSRRAVLVLPGERAEDEARFLGADGLPAGAETAASGPAGVENPSRGLPALAYEAAALTFFQPIPLASEARARLEEEGAAADRHVETRTAEEAGLAVEVVAGRIFVHWLALAPIPGDLPAAREISRAIPDPSAAHGFRFVEV